MHAHTYTHSIGERTQKMFLDIKNKFQEYYLVWFYSDTIYVYFETW